MVANMNLWFDPEGNFPEVQFSDTQGFMHTSAHDTIMERVDEQGHILGFSILSVSRFKKDRPLEAELVAGK